MLELRHPLGKNGDVSGSIDMGQAKWIKDDQLIISSSLAAGTERRL